jgi:hypothetical protein
MPFYFEAHRNEGHHDLKSSVLDLNSNEPVCLCFEHKWASRIERAMNYHRQSLIKIAETILEKVDDDQLLSDAWRVNASHLTLDEQEIIWAELFKCVKQKIK